MNPELIVGARELVMNQRGRPVARQAFGSEEGSLQAALQRLLPTQPRKPVAVRLAASHARMWLLPWLAQLTRSERWQNLATSRFEQIFGDTADGWVLRVAEDLPPRARLAAAIPESLVRSLQAVAKLRTVRISLLDSMGALLRREPAFSGCVAQVEADTGCLMMLWRGDLRRIRMRRFEAIEELAAAARSEWAAVCDGGSERAPSAAVAVLGGQGGAAASLSRALGSSRIVDLSPAGVPNR